MEAKELRIGNLVKPIITGHGISMIEVESVTSDKINVNFREYSLDDIEPITLTEEWLVKLGLEFNETTNHYFIRFNRHGETEQNMTLFIGNDDEIGYWYGVQNIILDDIAINAIQYVHQLQNLYFALTGQELEFKI